MKTLSASLAVVLLILASCSNESETDMLRSELEALKSKAEEQSLKKEIEEIKECSLNGGVFIVTRGGQNYKLGLVPVFVAEPDDIKSHLDSTFNALESLLLDERKEFESSEAALVKLLEEAKPELAAYTKAQSEFSTSIKNLKKYASVYQSLREVSISYQEDEGLYQKAASEFLQAKFRL